MACRLVLPGFYLALVVGIVPLSRVSTGFRRSLVGIFLCFAHLGFTVFTITEVALHLKSRLKKGFCTIDNKCLVNAVMSPQLLSEVTAIGGVFFHRKRTLNCLNQASLVLNQAVTKNARIPITSFMPIFFAVCILARLILLSFYREIQFSLTILGFIVLTSVSVEGLAGVLCLAIETGFGALNEELEKMTYSPSLAIALQRLRRRHGELCDLADNVDQRFGLDFLISIPVGFVQIVMLLYFAVVSFSPDTPAFPTWYFISTGTHFALTVTRVCYACYRFESVVSKADRAAVLVQKLNHRALDEESKEEIRFFTMQLISRRIQFSACGFFPLDFTLLYSIVGAITTYLVILIQFRPNVKITDDVSTSGAIAVNASP